MRAGARFQSLVWWSAAAFGTAAGAYAAYVALTWRRYGHAAPPRPGDKDDLLDVFMPVYDVVERHRVPVRAPAALTLAVARDMDVQGSPVARAIFKGREWLLGASPAERPGRRGLLAEVQSLGWVVLAEVPGRELVVGSVTKPWEPNVTFRSIPPSAFVAFNEPEYVKIAWTLRVDPNGPESSVFRTETRAVATDRVALTKFRWYWSLLSPGIIAIRWTLLWPVKSEAERRARRAAGSGS